MKNKKRILLFDIETMANKAFVWGKYEQNVIQYEKEWYMLSFAYKWLGEKETHVLALPDFSYYKKDKTWDFQLVNTLWELFDQAEVVIAHNGKSFDVKKTYAKFIEHGLPPPSPVKIVDTKLIAKRYFSFNSNKLDDIGNLLGLGRKIDTGGFDLWLGCAKGDEKSWAKMKKYNKQDVILLEKVYLKMLPYIVDHPNLSVLDDRGACANCDGEHLQKRGFGIRGQTRVQRYQCQDCGAWFQRSIAKSPVDKSLAKKR